RERDARRQAAVLETESGATAGFALLAPDARWFGDAWVVDLHTHPAFRQHGVELLRALQWPEAPCVTYRAPRDAGRNAEEAAWEAAGFRRAAVLPRWLSFEDERRDLEIWVRE